jgi:hypothetical protein
MLYPSENTLSGHSSNLLFMRRRQAADLLLSLAEGPNQTVPAKNLLMDALYQLPTQCFIADDWYIILEQITQTLLQQETKNGAGMPTDLNRILANIHQRLKHQAH